MGGGGGVHVGPSSPMAYNKRVNTSIIEIRNSDLEIINSNFGVQDLEIGTVKHNRKAESVAILL